jgi:hypothetical protein
VKRISRRLRSTLTAVTLAVGLVGAAVVAASPAQAWTAGHIYVSFPAWLGNCPQGGNVVGINAAVDGMWTGGDWGDDLVYPRVRVGDWNTVSAQNFCKQSGRPGGGYWAPAVSVRFYPTRSNQTVWVGPGGWRRN